ncbi:uncharacterized protein C8Q71DRAFT_354789 [Rhodofomes roseus]|uniref:Uncharacterized protein n=1 Tax=Rhodofomes roseus TaxID=34475 RepID=A0ABQ8KSY9_9APHY|nr:uncharacterized protein C8Q71DRAFT_354789 [Rhodofomes roseus]KAH9841930.1 hypothetical protein C8Q71DRAFT_354789 [Rhodofomes roseus]
MAMAMAMAMCGGAASGALKFCLRERGGRRSLCAWAGRPGPTECSVDSDVDRTLYSESIGSYHDRAILEAGFWTWRRDAEGSRCAASVC